MPTSCDEMFAADPRRRSVCWDIEQEITRLHANRRYGVVGILVFGLPFGGYLLIWVHYLPALFIAMFLVTTWLGIDSYFAQAVIWLQSQKRLLLVPNLRFQELTTKLAEIDAHRAKQNKAVFLAWFRKVLGGLGQLLKTLVSRHTKVLYL